MAIGIKVTLNGLLGFACYDASKLTKGEAMTYYSLLVFDPDAAQWGVQFGDYDRETVEQEQVDSFDGATCTIIKTDGSQGSIDAAVAALNN